MAVARHINDQPKLSLFSGTTPNSSLTGLAGDLAFNIGSASTDTRLWIKGGSPVTPSLTSWRPLHVGPL